jgi:hypothetical protein
MKEEQSAKKNIKEEQSAKKKDERRTKTEDK